MKLQNFRRLSNLHQIDQRAGFLTNMESIHEDRIENYDETPCNDDKIKKKQGRGIQGSPPIEDEWNIGGKSYSALGNYTTRGWNAWRICENNIMNSTVAHFLETDLKHLLTDDKVGLCYGASIHRHPNARAHLDRVFNGKWIICPRYSHDFYPV